MILNSKLDADFFTLQNTHILHMHIKISNIFILDIGMVVNVNEVNIYIYRTSIKKLKFKALVNTHAKSFSLRNILFKNIYIYISGYGLNSRQI